MFYPIARDAALERHGWRFAIRRAQLAELAQDAATGWRYSYALPAGCLKPWAVVPPYSVVPSDWSSWICDGEFRAPAEFDRRDFIIESMASGDGVIYTNVEQAILLYTARVTDTTKFTPMFVDALAAWLASYLAGPITKDARIKQSFFTLGRQLLSEAAVSDANTQKSSPYDNFTPSGIAARQ